MEAFKENDRATSSNRVAIHLNAGVHLSAHAHFLSKYAYFAEISIAKISLETMNNGFDQPVHMNNFVWVNIICILDIPSDTFTL